MLNEIMYLISRAQKKLSFSAVRNSNIDSTSVFEGGCQIVNSRFEKHTYCGYDCVILNCEIGAFCSIADGVIVGGSSHPMHYVSMSPVFLSHKDSVKAKFSKHKFSDVKKTTIGNDVWIGNRATILSGITIGHGAVVGAGAVVTKDVGDYCIVGGNPARVIRKRFDEYTIKRLLEKKWWNLEESDLTKEAELFNDVAKYTSKEEV